MHLATTFRRISSVAPENRGFRRIFRRPLFSYFLLKSQFRLAKPAAGVSSCKRLPPALFSFSPISLIGPCRVELEVDQATGSSWFSNFWPYLSCIEPQYVKPYLVIWRWKTPWHFSVSCLKPTFSYLEVPLRAAQQLIFFEKMDA